MRITMKRYVVYILASKPRGTLYIGVTNDLKKRIIEHREGSMEGFTKKYAIHMLVHFERFQYVNHAIAREKQLKRWHRDWKINLIEAGNPEWVDLYNRFFVDPETSSG